MSTPTPLGTLLQQIISAVEKDVVKDALPVINTFFTNIIANPANLNIVAQLAALQVNLLAALPTVESDVAKDVAALLQAYINNLITPPAPAPAGKT